MEIKLKRIYEPEEEGDGFRILVDRLYPRGIKKDCFCPKTISNFVLFLVFS